MTLQENIRLAFDAVRANMLRSFLTLMIIAFGIMALVGILTALDSVIYNMSSNLSGMGANSFSIERKTNSVKGNRRGQRPTKIGNAITYREANEFKERFEFPSTVTIGIGGTSTATVKYNDKKTNPTVQVSGIDENCIKVKGYDLSHGRNFSEVEIQNGGNKAIIGMDIVNLLFDKNPDKAINKVVTINNLPYMIIGILKSKGSSMTQNADRNVFIPLLTARHLYDDPNTDWTINVSINNAADMDNASSAASGLFRQIRKLRLGIDDDFEIFKSDGLIDILKENTATIRWATIAIGLITLLGAAIGLMNIMLVSVTERTREIGVCKALGATRQSIMMQFLIEAILICQMGGLIGIVFGILVGNIVSILLEGSFLIPWAWITLGVITCLVVGLASGLYPALKASKLDPIEALRYE